MPHATHWFSVSTDRTVQCPACDRTFEIGPRIDHHPGSCPVCGIDCVFLNWRGRLVMMLPGRSPQVVGQLLRWMQKNLDELEYAELIVALDEVASVAECDAASR